MAQLRGVSGKVIAGERLSRRTSLGVGGPADWFIEVETRDRLAALFSWARTKKVPLFPIGQGSNLLVGDGGLRGGVVRLRGDFEKLTFEGSQAEAGAGVLLPQLARAAAEKGLSGAEPFIGIPGTVGGGLMTNAGTPEGDLGALVSHVDVMEADGTVHRWDRDRLSFDYRRSNLAGRWVLGAGLLLRSGSSSAITALMEKQLARRSQRQPLSTRNCGSVFKNPPGDHAGRLVEAAGLKGLCVGGARVSPVHANFIENTGGATARDVRELIDRARRAVKERFGVELELEVWPVGED